MSGNASTATTNGWRIAGRTLGVVAFVLVSIASHDVVNAVMASVIWWGVLEFTGWLIDRNKAIMQAFSAASLPQTPGDSRTAVMQGSPVSVTMLPVPGPADSPTSNQSADLDAVLQMHLTKAADPPGPVDSAQSAEQAHSDTQCSYRGGDPRLEGVVTTGPAIAIVKGDGLELLIVRGSEVAQTYKYPAATVQMVDAGGGGWAADSFSFDAAAWTPQSSSTSNAVKIGAIDPEGIARPFCVCLDFRNPYYAQLFAKRMSERFCPVDMVEQSRLERERRGIELPSKVTTGESSLRQPANAAGDFLVILLMILAFLLIFWIVISHAK